MGKSRQKTWEILTKWINEDKGVSQAVANFIKISKGYDEQKAKAQEARQSAKAFGDVLKAESNQADEAARTHKRNAEFLARLADEYNVAGRAAEEYGDRAKRARDEVEQFGDVATNVSQISGALRGFGAGGVADVTMIGADIADAVEGFARLKPAITEVGQSVANALPLINSAGAGLATLGIAGGAAAIAITGLVALFQEMKRRADEAISAAKEAELSRLKGQELAIAQLADQDLAGRQQLRQQAEIEGQRLLALQGDVWADLTSNSEKALSRLQVLGQDTEEIFNTIDLNGSGTIDTLDEFNRVLNLLRGTTNIVGEANAGLIGAMEGELEQLDDLGVKFQDNTSYIEGLDSALALQIVSANEAANGIEKVNKALADTSVLAQAQADYQADLEQQAQRTKEAALDALDAERDRVNFYRELRSLADTSAQEEQLTNASAKRVESLTAAFDKFATDTEKRIGEIGKQLELDLAKAQRDFMAEGVAATQKYLDEERKAQDEYQRDRIRAIQDMNDDLLSAEEANDVIRFIEAQRAGEKRLKRLDEDASTEERQRSQEFVTAQKERRKEYQQRLVDLKTAAAQRIQAERDKLQERRALLQQQIADERAALTQQINDTRAAAVAMVNARRAQYQQELADQQKYNQQRALIEANYMKQIAAAAKQAASYTPPTYKTVTKTIASSASYSSPYTKTASVPTYSIGNISVGAGMTQTSVMEALRNALGSYHNAVVKAYAK